MAKKMLKIFKFSVVSVVILLIFTLFFGIGTLVTYKKDVEFNKELLTSCTTKLNIYDSNNNLTNATSVNGNKIVTLSELPSYVPECFISIEDKSFYNHNGLNYKRIVKAFITNLTSKSIKQGASTISQQLIKNTHLSSEKTFERKIKEVILTNELEKNCSKSEILETYLNVIYFGNSAYGLEDASLTYFNKPAKHLTLAESAGLAGLIRSPKNYSPIYNYENFIRRKNLVLQNLLDDKKISEEEFQNAINEQIKINPNNILRHKKIYENAVIDEACAVLNCSEKDIATMGLNIYSTLNMDIQKHLINTVSNEDYYQSNRNSIKPDSCMVVINSKTGAVEGFYGKGNFNFNSFKRQPGSAIKPILVYAPALENNIIMPLTKIDNSSININGYSPKNVSNNKKYVNIQECLTESLNIPAVKVLDYVGIDKAITFAKNNGIEISSEDKNLNIALGGFTEGINIIQLAGSYTALANSGLYSQPYFIEKITNKNGIEIYSNKKTKKRTMREDTAYLMTDMLKTATKTGTSKRLKAFNFDVAGKTGTVGVPDTNFNTDAWSVAYTTDNIICSWLGNGDGKSESTLEGSNNGGTYATSMVKNVLNEISKVNQPSNFIKPDSVIMEDIDAIAYDKQNIIIKANKHLNECYKMQGLFSIYNLPKDADNKFPSHFLNSDLVDGKIRITFNSYPTYDYKLYRVVNGNKSILEQYKNKYEQITYEDIKFPYDKEFYYLLEYCWEGITYNESTDNLYIESSQKKWFF